MILPLVFQRPEDYDTFQPGSGVIYDNVRRRVEQGDVEMPVRVDGKTITVLLKVSARMRRQLVAGGALNFVKAGIA